MIYQVLAVYDSKARAFLQPFCAVHTDIGLRVFKAAANAPEHQIHLHSEDFTLFHLGTFNDENAVYDLFEQKVVLGLASTFKGK